MSHQSNAPRQIILHMGFHKTATTSIQHSLAKNRSQLLTKGYLYPDFKLDNIALDNHSIPLFGLFSLHPQNYHVYIKKNWHAEEINPRFQELLDEYIASPHHLILSGEDISGLGDIPLLQLKQTLETENTHLRPIVFIRHPLTEYISTTQENHKAGGNSLQFNHQYNCNSVPFINKLKFIFPNVEFYTFDKAVAFPGGPVAFFLHLLQLVPQDYQIVKKNESISMPAGQLLSYINQQVPLILNNKINFTRTTNDYTALFEIKGEKFTLLKQEISPHYEQIIRDIDLIEKSANIKFNLSEVNLDDFPVTWQWDDSAISSALTQLPKLSDGILYRIYDYFFYLFKRHQLKSIDLARIGDAIENELNNRRSNTKIGQLKDHDAEYLRDAAIMLENTNRTLALQLMKLAQQARPHGPFIQKKLQDWNLEIDV